MKIIIREYSPLEIHFECGAYNNTTAVLCFNYLLRIFGIKPKDSAGFYRVVGCGEIEKRWKS